MALSSRDVTRISELLADVTESPDFSFLYDWRPDNEATFFPRLNNTEEASRRLTRIDREKMAVAINAIEDVQELLSQTGKELSTDRGFFSNSISVFHKDGEVSLVAIPVTRETERSMGGYLFAHDLWAIPNSELFVEDLQNLHNLVEPTQAYLSWRWWPVAKATRVTNERSARQLLLSATNPSNRNVHIIADLVESRASLANGTRTPDTNDWKQALSKLESLSEFSQDALVATIDLSEMDDLLGVMHKLRNAYSRRDRLVSRAKLALEQLSKARVESHINALLIDDFARKVRGKGFARKQLIDMLETYHREPTLGNVLKLATERRYLFDTKTLAGSLELIRIYAHDQELLVGYPRLSDTDQPFEKFLKIVYENYLDQARPYPPRAQFEAFSKLIEQNPKQLHLIAQDDEELKRLFHAIDVYQDETRLTKLTEAYTEPSMYEARQFFKENPATFQAILSSMGLNALTLEQISGFLAPELTSEIRNIEIDTSGMKSPLRSYQLFGVQYGLHQKRVILGDEMGLGKTVTALGLAKHLENNGHSRMLVILPLAVLENWRREVLKHTDFEPRVLYGETLENDLSLWLNDGGLALATFESLQKVNELPYVSELSRVDFVVVDEAHYIKNPATKRTRGVLPWVRHADWVMLMSGTPLENKLEEFEQLISYVQPHLAIPADKLAYAAFRRAIAPAYLRRNQLDVLQELPDLQDDEEYIELSDADAEYYRRALKAGDWHAARRAKIMAGTKSSTVQRIQSIVSEAMENDHKVLIFSFYREVINVLQRVLKEDDPYEPLTGDLSSVERQSQVDAFTKAKDPGVLLAQITAGGTGLNIQAASIVILVEPQTKPSLEEQAIRRAYRMGQTKNVQVIRLRGKDTIDSRWVSMLEAKRKVFAATAGVSDAQMLDSIVANETGNVFKDERKHWGVES